MIVELIIHKDRMPFLIEALNENNIKISEHNKDTNLIIFELKNSHDILTIYHAGITIGIFEEKNLKTK